MRTETRLKLAALLVFCAGGFIAFGQSTAFVYQGRLNDGAVVANGSYDLRFALYDAPSGGTQQGNPLTSSPTGMTNGVFTVTLDFGDQFSGAERWLEIAVRPTGGGAFTTLSPRQRLTSSPYAVTAGRVTGPVNGSLITAGSITGTQLAAGTVTASNLASNAVTALNFAGGAVVLSEDGVATNLTAAGYKSFGKTQLTPESWVTAGDPNVPPSTLSSYTTVWTGTEMIMWNGSGASYNPALQYWKNASGGDARYNHSAIWTGTEMIAWGGEASGSYLFYGARYNPATGQWGRIPTSLTAASYRVGHSAVWTGSEMLVWGGYTNNANLGPYGYTRSGARYNPGSGAWTLFAAPSTVTARRDHTAIWTGTEMLIWGGWVGSPLNTGARYNPTTDSWTLMSTVNAPAARDNYVAVWTGSELLIWGGLQNGTYTNTGSRYNLATDTWTDMTTAGAPSGRDRACGVWTGSELIIWGGNIDPSGQYLNDGKRYNPTSNTWTPISSVGAPSARAVVPPRQSSFSSSGACAVWTGTEMVVVNRNNSATNDVVDGGRYNPVTDTWQTINRVRNNFSAVWTGTEMLVWGGNNGVNPLNSGFRLNPSNGVWTPLPATGAPQARSHHTAVWTGTDMIVWGGVAGSTFLNNGARFNPVNNTWSPVNASSGLAGRYEHTAVWTGTQMVVWGGSNGGFFNDGARYNPATDSWAPVTTSGAPALRTIHTAVWTGTEMVVWGGLGASSALNTGGRYNPVANTWLPVNLAGAPSPRIQHTAAWTGTEMVIWGGSDTFGNRLNTGASYKPATDTWTTLSTANAPSARAQSLAIWTGNELVIWGGDTGGALSGTGGVFNPRLNTWQPITSSGAPSARSSAPGVWTGTAVLFWGGYGGSGVDTDPSAYLYTPERVLYYYLKL